MHVHTTQHSQHNNLIRVVTCIPMIVLLVCIMSSEHDQLTELLQHRVKHSISASHNDNNDIFSDTTRLQQLINNNPRTPNTTYSYGTSGFRGHSSALDSIVIRCGMIAVVRSHSYTANNRDNTPNAVGIMITASHNDAPDNGIKFIDSNGSMLDSQWELCTDTIANADESHVIDAVRDMCVKLNIPTQRTNQQLTVLVAHDTRESSPHLLSLLQQSIQLLHGSTINYNTITTPQLHWLVANYNLGKPDISVNDYNQSLSTAFIDSIHLCNTNNKLSPLILDCSNGVGTLAIKQLQPLLTDVLAIELRNTDIHNTDLLNNECGAEYVQKQHNLPYPYTDGLINHRLASLDGDADRLVYYYMDTDKQFNLLDGDKLITLYTTFLLKLLDMTQLTNQLQLGIIQTAYANGASTRYITQQLNIPCQFTSTGVKHLHHKAIQYDIGIYFESNGHGTVVFSPHAIQCFQQVLDNTTNTTEQHNAGKLLLLLVKLINQYIGDALSDLLLVELSLHYLQWSIQQWNSIYHDIPSIAVKCKVTDRTLIKTTNADRICIEPQGLQSDIDHITQQYNSSRCFVRASGTEDVVRIYAEADTIQHAKQLAEQVVQLVNKYLN